MTTASTREIYVLGKELNGNREVKVVEAGEVHDLPAEAKFGYTSQNTKFPYTVAP
jgi:hypothetical protein